MRYVAWGFVLLGVLPQWSCEARPAGAGGYFSLEVCATAAQGGAVVRGIRARAFLPGGTELAERQSGEDGTMRWDRVVEGVVVRLEDPQRRFVALERRILEGEGSILCELTSGFTKTLRVVTFAGKASAAEAIEAAAVPVVAQVEVWPMEGARERVTTDAEGRATIGPLARGELKLVVSAPGFETAVYDFSVRSRPEEIGDLRIERGGAELRGRIDTGRETRATHVAYRLQGVLLEATVTRDGHFALSGLPRGSGTLVVCRHDRELFTRDVVIRGSVIDLGVLRPGEVASGL